MNGVGALLLISLLRGLCEIVRVYFPVIKKNDHREGLLCDKYHGHTMYTVNSSQFALLNLENSESFKEAKSFLRTSWPDCGTFLRLWFTDERVDEDSGSTIYRTSISPAANFRSAFTYTVSFRSQYG